MKTRVIEMEYGFYFDCETPMEVFEAVQYLRENNEDAIIRIEVEQTSFFYLLSRTYVHSRPGRPSDLGGDFVKKITFKNFKKGVDGRAIVCYTVIVR